MRLAHYRPFARLGSGGMADVYLAASESAMNVNRLVVIKRLRSDQANDDQAREMLLTEARIAARLNHPNIIQTIEAGSEGDSVFIAMEYIDGQPLSRLLSVRRRSGLPLEPRIAARICADALHGLHHAHELRDFDGTWLALVHRDVSPQNIMVSYEGIVKIVDFGIAKAAGTVETEHGVFKGKVSFMAPEQVRGERADRRADVFAAGIVLWEALTGVRLMADRDPAATVCNVLTKRIPRPSELNPSVPPELDAILERALRRDREARYQTAREMHEELESFIARAGRTSADEVGDLMKALFAEQRAAAQTQIRDHLATLSLGRRHTTVELGRTQVRTWPSALARLDDGFATTASADSAVKIALANATRRSLRIGAVVLSLASVVALVVSGATLVRSPRPTSAEVVPPAASPIPTTASPLLAGPPASETATVPVTIAPRRTPAPPARFVAPHPARSAPSAPPSSEAAVPKAPEPSAPGRTFRRDL